MATTALLPGGRRGIGATVPWYFTVCGVVGNGVELEKLCSCCVSVGKINRLSF